VARSLPLARVAVFGLWIAATAEPDMMGEQKAKH
jgi:hypothetical protein